MASPQNLSENEYYDDHSLMLTTGPFNRTDIEKVLNNFRDNIISNWKTYFDNSKFDKYQNEIKSSVFIINVVTSAKPNEPIKLFGRTYVYTSKALRNILLGKNPDGSQAVKEIFDPNWVEPSIESLGFNPKNYNIREPGAARDLYLSMGYKIGSMADMGGFDEWLEESFEPEMIKTPLQLPRLEMINFVNAEQRNYVRDAMIEKLRKNDPNADISNIKVEDKYTIEVRPLMGKIMTKPGADPITLISRNVPNSITLEDIQGYLSIFNRDPKTFRVVSGGVQKEILYPDIRFEKHQNTQTIYVQYSKDSDYVSDATFALYFCRQLNVNNTNLIFDYYQSGKNNNNQEVAPRRTTTHYGNTTGSQRTSSNNVAYVKPTSNINAWTRK